MLRRFWFRGDVDACRRRTRGRDPYARALPLSVQGLAVDRHAGGGACQIWWRGEGKSRPGGRAQRLEEQTSELQSLMRISYAVFCLKKKNKNFFTLRCILYRIQ